MCLLPPLYACLTVTTPAGVDLNRNFPSPFKAAGCAGKEPELCSTATLASTAGVQPEVRAVMAWALNSTWPFTYAANFHDGATVVNYVSQPASCTLCSHAVCAGGKLI